MITQTAIRSVFSVSSDREDFEVKLDECIRQVSATNCFLPGRGPTNPVALGLSDETPVDKRAALQLQIG